MMNAIWLFLLIDAVIAVTVWMIFTNKMTKQERDEMLDDDEMWP